MHEAPIVTKRSDNYDPYQRLSTTKCSVSAAIVGGMKMTRGQRLRAAREAAGYKSGAKAAEALDMKPSTYNSHERAGAPGARDYDPEDAAKYARKFRVDDTWLLTGKGRGPGKGDDEGGHIESSQIAVEIDAKSPQKRKTKIVGYVGAAATGIGGHLYAFSQDKFEEVDRPMWANDRSVAVEIKGASFGPLLEKWLVYYDDVRSPITEDLYGETCVIGLADDRILIKQIVRRGDGGFDLLSNSGEEPIRDAVIEWAAKVIGVAPR